MLFVIYENLGDKPDSPHHWLVINLNLVARRFEVLDSLRGEKNEALISSSGRVISKIKEAWDVFYDTSKTQIRNFNTQFIDVPKQTNP